MSSRLRRKPKRDVLAGKRDPTSQLYRAVRRYVEHHGGSVLVIGGIEVQKWPEDRELIFKIAVKCMGRRPSSPKAS